jgi:hypothetical protein
VETIEESERKMAHYPGSVTSVKVRQGASIARGTTIDEYLGQSDVDLLYENWQAGWPEPLAFSGGVKAVTCEMVLEVPFADFKKVFKKRAQQIYDVAKRNATR